jgi:N-methylhydantoinase A
MLLGDLKHDYVRSYLTSFPRIDKDHFLDLYRHMKETGIETLVEEGVHRDDIDFHPVLDLRYVGQYHEVELPVRWEDVESYNLDRVRKAFHDEHNRLFGYSLEEEGTEIELINVRLRVIGRTEKPRFLSEAQSPVSLDAALKGRRDVYIPETSAVEEVPVFDGDLQLGGNTIKGPAVIEKVNTTIFVGDSYDCQVDKHGSFIVYSRTAFPDGYKKDN